MKQIIIIVLSLAFTSCGAKKYLTSSLNSNEVRDVDYFEPFTYIELIEKGNKSVFSDSLSTITKRNIDSLLLVKKNQFRLTDRMALENDAIKTGVENELGYLTRLIFQKRKLDGIEIPPTIDSILEKNNQRFAMAIVATGFGRKKGNFGGQVAKGVAVGILTLGMAVPTPVKSNLTIYTYIFDSYQNEIAFYRGLMPDKEKEPTNPDYTARQLTAVFKGYYYPKN